MDTRPASRLCRAGTGALPWHAQRHCAPHTGVVHLSGAHARHRYVRVPADYAAANAPNCGCLRGLRGRRSIMTDIAPHMTAYLRQRLPVERSASQHTCDTYAYAFQLLLHFVSQKRSTAPSALQLEHIDAPLVLEFLEYLQKVRG
jgi:hypothetical protein